MLLLIGALLLLQPVVNAHSLRLFHIERNKNNSIVCYDLETDDGVAINKKNPISVYWEMPDKGYARNTLSALQNRLAYGFIVEQMEENSVHLKLKAYPQREVEVVYDTETQEANAFTTINGSPAILNKLYIHAAPPFYNSVEYIILSGFNPATGEPVMEKITNK